MAGNTQSLSRMCDGTGSASERRAGLAPASPRRKRGVFPWTTNALPTNQSCGDQLVINSSACTADGWRHGTTGARSFRPDVSFLALDGDEVAGYLLSHEYDAETAMTGVRECWIARLGTRPPWRGSGVATALLTTCLRAGQQQGFHRAGLNVDSANATGALSLYERCGFRTLHTWVGYVRPL